LPHCQWSALRTTTHAAAPLDQAMAIQHRMDGAFGRSTPAHTQEEPIAIITSGQKRKHGSAAHFVVE